MDAPTKIRRRLTGTLAYAGRTESTVLLEEPEYLDAALLQEEEEAAKAEAEKARPGLTMFTDGSRMGDGAAGYAVMWKKGVCWAGIGTHMGYNQEAYDAECAARTRLRREETRSQNGSPCSQVHKRPSDGWHRTALARDSSALSRRGSALQRYRGPGRASSPKSDGARRTRELPATRKPTSRQRLRRRSQAPMGWNG